MLIAFELINKSNCEEKTQIQSQIPTSNTILSSIISQITIPFIHSTEPITESTFQKSQLSSSFIDSLTSYIKTQETSKSEMKIQSSLISDGIDNNIDETKNNLISQTIPDNLKTTEIFKTTTQMDSIVTTLPDIFPTSLKSTIPSMNSSLTSIPITNDNQTFSEIFETMPSTIEDTDKKTINTNANSFITKSSNFLMFQTISTNTNNVQNSDITQTTNTNKIEDIISTMPQIISNQIPTTFPSNDSILSSTQANTNPKYDDIFSTNPLSKELMTSSFPEPEKEITTTQILDSIGTSIESEDMTKEPIFTTSKGEIIPTTEILKETYGNIQSNYEIIIPSSDTKETSIITSSNDQNDSEIINNITAATFSNSENNIYSSTIYIPEKINTSLPINPNSSIILPSTQHEQIIASTIPETILTTIPKIIQTTIVDNNQPQIKEKVFFLLQAQIINKRLVIFLIINFPINKNQKFIFIISKYLSRNLRILQKDKETEEIIFYPKEDYDENGNQLISFISENEVDEENFIIENLKNNEEIDFKILNDNPDVLDTKKVKDAIQKGGMDYSKIEENKENYYIYQYKIVSTTYGCEFALNSENKIIQNNKSIELSFLEIGTNNKIKTSCLLSNNNDKKIICSLFDKINSNYLLEPYIFSDEIETITIVQKNTSDYLSLECNIIKSGPDEPHNKKNEKLSVGAIIAIILGILFSAISYCVCYL